MSSTSSKHLFPEGISDDEQEQPNQNKKHINYPISGQEYQMLFENVMRFDIFNDD